MLTDTKPNGEGDAIHVQCVQTVYEVSHWVNTTCGLAKPLFWLQ